MKEINESVSAIADIATNICTLMRKYEVLRARVAADADNGKKSVDRSHLSIDVGDGVDMSLNLSSLSDEESAVLREFHAILANALAKEAMEHWDEMVELVKVGSRWFDEARRRMA